MAIGNPITLTSNVASKTVNVIATASQSLFTVTGGYRINEIAVFRNGVRLVDGRDFTARDGSTVTLLSAASEGDALEFQVFDTFRVADAITPFDSDQTIAGNLNITGILSASQLGSVNFNVTSGIQTFHDVRVGGALTVAGTLTYEDTSNSNVTGIATFSDQVSIGDSIFHTGDTDTSIRFPAADTFAVETAGSERIRIRSNGVIVKGNSGTQVTLGNGANTQLIGSGSADSSLALIRQASGGGEFYFAAGTSGTNIADDNGLGFIKFMGYHTNGYDEYARIEALVDGTNGDGDAPGRLIFRTSADGSATPTERLRIDSSGTASFAGDVSIVDKIIHTGDTNTAIRFPAADTFTVETAGSERLRVSSNVGVGDDNPSVKLNVKGSGDSLAGLNVHSKIEDTTSLAANVGGMLAFEGVYTSGDAEAVFSAIHGGKENATDGNYAGYLRAFTRPNGGLPAERLRIDSSGRLLINKTTNRDKYFNGTYSGQLQVEGTSDATRLTQFVHNQNSASQPILILGKSRGTSVGSYTVVQDGDFLGTLSFQGADGDEMVDGARIDAVVNGTVANDSMPTDIVFKTNQANERVRFTNTGRIGIGSDDPQAFLVVQGNSNDSTLPSIRLQDGTDARQVQITNTSGDFLVKTCGSDNNTHGSFKIFESGIIALSNGGASGSNVERLRIDTVGTFHFKNGAMVENGIVDTTARNGTQAVNLDNGMVHYFQSSSTGTWKPNFRVNSTNTLNDAMGTGDVVSPTMIVNKSNTAHYADTIQVDGSDVTPEWLSGAPTDGGGNNTFDVYSYTILKTGNAAFKCFASVSNYT